MAFSNADKQRHGQSAQDSLESILKRCADIGYIKEVRGNFRIGKSGYSNTAQFYAPFLIVFFDGAKWALFTTTSMRTDRIKGQQWDAINLKEIDSGIKSVFLVYSDGISENEKADFIRQRNKYLNKEEFSAIDDVVSQDQIYNMIEAYALGQKSNGQIKDMQGNSYEGRIAALLSYPDNLRKWKCDDGIIEGMHYDAFKMIVECFGLNPNTTEKIEATSDKKIIGHLPTGGNPKTDVLVTAVDIDGKSTRYTISCKRSSEKSVSVHQYTADTFADVLDKDNEPLRRLLNYFQKCGSLSAFGEEKTVELTQALKPYVEKLSLWVIGGNGGGGNPDTQCAEFILTYDNNDGTSLIHRTQEYCRKLEESKTKGNFGTPFSWTYPSKRRGESIQLKCRIIK